MNKSSIPQKFPVAIIQARPEYLNLDSTVAKTLSWIEKAAREGAKLVCFSETWLPGYPAWLDYCPDAALWNHAPVKEIFAKLRANSVSVPGQELSKISEAAARFAVGVVIGINERVDSGVGHGTLYNSLLFIDECGRLLNHHRKLIPTYTERLIWGQGDARGLKSMVMNGARVGGLVCWEHWMPLARQALHNCREQIHIAAWPTVHEMHQVASRHYAFEGRCFVLAAGQILRASELPSELKSVDGLASDSLVERGGSAIIAPDGRYIAGPVYDQEALLTGELDLSEIEREVMTLDVTGHYSRPDIFDFSVISETREEERKDASRTRKRFKRNYPFVQDV
jgi:nitrilase